MDKKKYKAIVIGTSAGGLHVLSELLGSLPSDYPVPVIVVQHRSNDNRDLLEEVLQSKCIITIKQADEKEQIRSGCVYIAPPDYHLLVESNYTFSLSSDEYVCYSRPSIDVLFESAAAVYKQELAGIILTGANSDGSSGIEIIAQYGGMTIAQEPEEALFSAMPSAAVATGKVKLVLKISEIRQFLLSLENGYDKRQ